MKKTVFIYLISLLLFNSCSETKKKDITSNQLIFQLDSVDGNSGLQRMQTSTVHQDIDINGNKYKLYINRTPSDSLNAVKSEAGLFADNRIIVSISNEKGVSIFSKTFTKNLFSQYLPNEFLSKAILEGVVYDDEKSDASGIINLAASVSFPLSDLYVPFTITISKNGSMTIIKDENMDNVPDIDNKQ